MRLDTTDGDSPRSASCGHKLCKTFCSCTTYSVCSAMEIALGGRNASGYAQHHSAAPYVAFNSLVKSCQAAHNSVQTCESCYEDLDFRKSNSQWLPGSFRVEQLKSGRADTDPSADEAHSGLCAQTHQGQQQHTCATAALTYTPSDLVEQAQHASGDIAMTDDVEEVSYYDLLALPRDATQEQIRKAYLRYSTVLHPDKQADEALRDEASAYFVRIKEAHEVLLRASASAANHGSKVADLRASDRSEPGALLPALATSCAQSPV